MRLLLSFMIAVALALLPVGGTVRSAHAAAGGQHPAVGHSGCHKPVHAAPGSGRSHYSDDAHSSHGANHAQAAEASANEGGSPALLADGHVLKSATAACRHCGPDCHCVGVCGVSCAGPADEAVVHAPFEHAGGVRPSPSAALSSLSLRPRPPPPRA